MSAETPASTESTPDTASVKFADLGLPEPLLRALADVGYESPSPDPGRDHPAAAGRPRRARPGADRHRQDRRVRAAGPGAASIPTQTQAAGAGAGADARTGDPGRRGLPELRHTTCPASTCCRSTAARATARSCRRCKRGVHVVVGTPGPRDRPPRARLAGPVRSCACLVLDEADEMLRMGFIDDVEAVLKKTPGDAPGRAVLGDHAGADPAHRPDLPAAIRSKSRSRPRPPPPTNIRQRYWLVSGMHKLDALTRILEAEPFDAMIVFARTKLATDELAEQAAGARLRRRRDQRRHAAGAAREHHPAAQGRQDRHPGRHRRGRARPRRGAHQPRAELRHPLRHRKLRAPHRPHRPRRPQRRGDPVRHPARARHAARDRARHAPADRADGAAERRDGQRPARVASSSAASPTRWKPATWRCSATWSSATSASRTCRRSKSPRRWPSWCRATCRCCWTQPARTARTRIRPRRTHRAP